MKNMKPKTMTVMRALAMIGAAVIAMACPSTDVPNHEPTLGTGGADGADAGDGGDAGDDGVDDTSGGEPELKCWPDDENLTNATLFQCSGIGSGQLTWEAYKGSWKADMAEIMVEFPSQSPEDPNAQACCESDATEEEIDIGCVSDCQRAACNLAIQKLQEKLDAGPPDGCTEDCPGRFEQTISLWISFLQENFDLCLQAVEENLPMNLPNPPSVSDTYPWGAGRSAVLTATCTTEAQEVIDLEQSCEESHNEAMSAVAHMWVCNSIEGDVEIDGPQGYGATTFEGSMTLWRGFCDQDPCWFQIESLELDAANFSQNGYATRNMHASLGYVGVGPYVNADEGSIALGMFGLDVTMEGDTPSTSWQRYAFPMANSEAAAFAVPNTGQIQIVDAYFAWDDHEVTITSDVANCYCATCT